MPIYFLLKKRKTEASFREKAMEDKRVVKLFRMGDEGSYAINTRELIQELEDSHLSRQYKTFRSNEFVASAQVKLIEWTAEVERNRSRAISIQIECVKIHFQLQQAIKDMKNYLLVKYREELAQEHNTMKDKASAVDNILEPFNKLLKKLETVLKISDIIINDLRQSHFSKESMIEILKMNYKGS